MTGAETVVDVQWALYGKAVGPAEDRVLACSTGDLAMGNFADAISRFQLGTLHSLPQVSVSYAKTGQSGRNYLALAIHKPADRGQVALDDDGRPVTYTHYFCLPYAPLAGAGVTYLAMHEALRGLRLPAVNGPPLRVPVASPSWPPPALDHLAMRVAALLLTGRSVCVLRAQDVPVAGRLGFIDAVMTLLPYGFRAKMTGATWTRATYRDHRFRLFFSDAPRAGQRRDHVVSWGHPETAVITAADGAAHEYLTWLEATVIRPIAGLTRLTDAYGFGDAPVQNAVRIVTQSPPAPALGPAPMGGPAPVPGASVPEAERAAAPERAAEPGQAAAPGQAAEPEGAAGPDSAAGTAPAPGAEAGPASGLRAVALAFWRVREEHPDRLTRWFASGQVDAVRLITLLAGEQGSPADARMICDLTLNYLETMRRNGRSPALRQVLSEHGFLAQMLAAGAVGDDQYQVTALAGFLRAAYPDGLDRPAILQVLAGDGALPTPALPTPALLAAVLTCLARPKDAHLAREAYARGSVTRLRLDPGTSGPLAGRLPLFDYDQPPGP